jgi:hypothetical protein
LATRQYTIFADANFSGAMYNDVVSPPAPGSFPESFQGYGIGSQYIWADNRYAALIKGTTSFVGVGHANSGGSTPTDEYISGNLFLNFLTTVIDPTDTINSASVSLRRVTVGGLGTGVGSGSPILKTYPYTFAPGTGMHSNQYDTGGIYVTNNALTQRLGATNDNSILSPSVISPTIFYPGTGTNGYQQIGLGRNNLYFISIAASATVTPSVNFVDNYGTLTVQKYNVNNSASHVSYNVFAFWFNNNSASTYAQASSVNFNLTVSPSNSNVTYHVIRIGDGAGGADVLNSNYGRVLPDTGWQILQSASALNSGSILSASLSSAVSSSTSQTLMFPFAIGNSTGINPNSQIISDFVDYQTSTAILVGPPYLPMRPQALSMISNASGQSGSVSLSGYNANSSGAIILLNIKTKSTDWINPTKMNTLTTIGSGNLPLNATLWNASATNYISSPQLVSSININGNSTYVVTSSDFLNSVNYAANSGFYWKPDSNAANYPSLIVNTTTAGGGGTTSQIGWGFILR